MFDLGPLVTIQESLKKYPTIEIDLLLTHVLGKTKEFLYTHPNHKLTIKQFNNLTKLVKRRLKGEPIAYIVGYKYFYGLKFKVTPNVLIPRPETEWLVERSLSILRELTAVKNGSIKVLDLGTGSGNIIISLSSKIQDSSSKINFFASDISKSASNIAKLNSVKHKTKVKFIHSDLFNNVNQKFDLIITNLPYTSTDNYQKLLSDLEYEPKRALTDGTDSWQIYKRFFSQVGNHLRPNGIILLEIDPKAKPFITRYAKHYLPKTKLRFFKDLRSLWRYMEVQI